MVIGVVAALIGILGDHSEHHQRTWASLFVNGFFFFGIALGTLYFFALQYVTESSWSVMVKRVYEGIMSFLPIGAIVVVVVLLAGAFGVNHIWHWMAHETRVLDEASPNAYDPVIAHKAGWLVPIFFWMRTIVYLSVFILFARWFRRQSLAMDQQTGDTLLANHFRNYRRGVAFIVLFAFCSTAMAWDWIMSIDTHWFSTLFGWYVFSGMWVSAMITALILVLYLRRKGYLPQVNNSHVHDMGKWVFAISFLWSYLWFSQFMLIWYADIPEEVIYYQIRINEHPWLLWGMFFVNFAIPMVLLMSRDAKRNPRFLITVATIIFFGHWCDVVQLVMPGALGEHFDGIGTLELGMLAAFLGVFIITVLNALTKAPLTPVHHPYLDESVHHHT
ncbi:MAG: quinol:cytochrome C oxidoreductase [Flavobacteriales bacterium]|nr:quinol:cytochrome C oxidoreductase [Flavobacteriales bacterium]MCB9193160.1 quinol:cytochrome C oxidoreductase [Flavobacteriales bacterium]